MSTAMVDLSSLQPVNFGNGVTGSYDPNSGTYYDSGGNVLSASDLAQYGSFTVGSPGASGAPATSPAPTPVNASGNGGTLSGLSGLFSSLGNAIVTASRPPTIASPSGTLVYNPATGSYTTASAITAQSALNPLILLVLAAGLIWLVMEKA